MRKVKRFFITALTLTAAALLTAIITLLLSRLAFRVTPAIKGVKYAFYVGDTSKNCTVVESDPMKASMVRLTLSGVCGESLTCEELDLDEFLKSVNGKIVFTEELSDSVNYYCTADLPYSVNLYGKQINLHVCVKESGVTVASPIIFGGY